jgi:hypothetical protein
MHAIDEVERIKRDGTLTCHRFAGSFYNACDKEVVEAVIIELTTPQDTPDSCVEQVTVEWVPYFACGELAPRITAIAGSLKMLALFPKILRPFHNMVHGQLTPEAFIQGLLKIGVNAPKQQTQYAPYVSPALTCVGCEGLFSKRDYPNHGVDSHKFKCQWCAYEPSGSDRTGESPQRHTAV